MAREQELLRDLAKLVLKYDVDDWRFVIGLIRDGGPENASIAAAITHLVSNKPQLQKVPKASRNTAVTPKLDGIPPERAEALGILYQRLRSRQLLPTAVALREAYVGAGGKEKVPPKRDLAIRLLIQHLATVPETVLTSVVRQIGESRPDLRDEYSRWFTMILDANRTESNRA